MRFIIQLFESAEARGRRLADEKRKDDEQRRLAALRAARKRLLDAIRQLDIAGVESALLADPSLIQSADPDGDADTVLHVACHTNSVEIVRHLLARGADPNAKGDMGQPPLHIAAYWGNLEIVQSLLKGGANVNATDNVGWTAIHKLILHLGKLEQSAAEGQGRSVRFVAAGPVTLSCLLENGADPNCPDNLSFRPLKLLKSKPPCGPLRELLEQILRRFGARE
jgi:hypothetical protein